MKKTALILALFWLLASLLIAALLIAPSSSFALTPSAPVALADPGESQPGLLLIIGCALIGLGLAGRSAGH